MPGSNELDLPEPFEEEALIEVAYQSPQSDLPQSVAGQITDVDDGIITVKEDRERYEDGPTRRLQIDTDAKQISSITSKRTTQLGEVAQVIFRGPPGMDSNEAMNASIHARLGGHFQRSGIFEWYDPTPHLDSG